MKVYVEHTDMAAQPFRAIAMGDMVIVVHASSSHKSGDVLVRWGEGGFNLTRGYPVTSSEIEFITARKLATHERIVITKE